MREKALHWFNLVFSADLEEKEIFGIYDLRLPSASMWKVKWKNEQNFSVIYLS
jgi:hypothetical protein